MATNCKVGGCANPVQEELFDSALCLEHFLSDVQERSSSFARQLEEQSADQNLHTAAMKFIMVAAAKIATIGMQNPPEDQLARGRLLNAMLLLAELRERLDKAASREHDS